MSIILTVLGTRPEIIKMSPLIPLFDERFDKHILVHTGQHYSENMDKVIFQDLDLREPDYYLKVGSGNPGAQTATIISKVEEIILKDKPDAVVVHGDTNSTLGGALAAAKYKADGIKLIHVESGARSHNDTQAEEVNRKIVDTISDLLLPSAEIDYQNLKNEGFPEEKIRKDCNTVIDAALRTSNVIDTESILGSYGIQDKKFALATFHRQETVDTKECLSSLVDSIETLSSDFPIVIPLHPRTKKMLENFSLNLRGKHLKVIDPVGYKEMICLLKSCKFLMTDSGGLQDEAMIFSIPTLVLRTETEYQSYVDVGRNDLVGANQKKIESIGKQLISDDKEYERRRNIEIPFKKDRGPIIVCPRKLSAVRLQYPKIKSNSLL